MVFISPTALRRSLLVLIGCLAGLLVFAGSAAAAVPTASTGDPTAMTDTAAELNGAINPNGEDTSVHFEYGTTTAYGSSTLSQDIGSGPNPVFAHWELTGLAPNTTYHYRVVASNASAPPPGVSGGDKFFTTGPPPPPNAAFTPDAATVLVGSPVGFDGTKSGDQDGNITGYSWNFGDGGSSTASQPSHTYGKPGDYNVTLAVTDNFGNRSQVTHQIKVIAPPPLQTLIETIAPLPTVLRSGSPPAISGHWMFDLGERVFCPGTGPSCSTTVNAIIGGTAHNAQAGRTAMRTLADSSSEIKFKLTKQAFKRFRTKRQLSMKLTIVSVRGSETAIDRLSVRLRLKKH